MNVRLAMLSDVGRVRSGNEDSVLYKTDPEGKRGHLLVVADGMGGAESGEVASNLAVQTVAEVYFHSSEPPALALQQALTEANARIRRAPSEGSGTDGMGTTCTVLAVVDQKAYLAYVGDSRAYQVRGKCLSRLTRDQSVWADHVRAGGQPSVQSGRNELTHALGLETALEPSPVQEITLQSGDRFLLCSDGLWGLVTDYEILTLARAGDLEETCRRLVALANKRGGHDNVTVALAEVQG